MGGDLGRRRSRPAGRRLARISTEVATLARDACRGRRRDASGIVVGAGPGAAAAELATLPAARPGDRGARGRRPRLVGGRRRRSPRLVASETPDVVLVGAGPDGRDLAGAVSALDRPRRPGQRDRRDLDRRRPIGRDERVRRQARPRAGSHAGGAASSPSARMSRPPRRPRPPGTVEPARRRARRRGRRRGRRPRHRGRAAAPIEEARIIVAGGRGVGGPDGFGLVRELAEALGGAVGATRAAVDSGWIPYSQQIGQTGKIVKPELYLALGISGAIQHKVGMQTSGTIVAVNRDPDAPIAEFADLFVVGRPVRGRAGALEPLRARRAERGRVGPWTGSLLLPIAAFIALAAGLASWSSAAPAGSSRGRARSSSSGDQSRPRGPGGRVARWRCRSDRRRPPPAARSGPIGDTLVAATDAVQRYTEEARALAAAPGPRRRSARTSSRELERAGRPSAMVEHGTTMLASVAAAPASSRRRRRSSAAIST